MRAAWALLAMLVCSGCLGASGVVPLPALPGPAAPPRAAATGCTTECGVTVADGTYREFEPSIAINPRQPATVAVSAAEDMMSDAPGYVTFPLGLTSPVSGSNGPLQTPGSYRIGIHTSHDAGRTWATHFLPWLGNAPPTSLWNLFCVYGDPVLFYGGDGVLHVVAVGAECATELKADQTFHLLHAASADDGATWGEPSIVALGEFVVLANDKPWAAIDPVTDHVAVAWTQFTALGFATQDLIVAVSDDGGADWGLPHAVVLGGALADVVRQPVLEEPQFNYDLAVAWGQDHALHVAYMGYCTVPPAQPLTDRPDCVKAANSADDGATWTHGIVVAHVQDPDRPGARHVMANYAALAVDRSGGAHDGRIYCAYMDAAQGDYDVLASWSDDHGATWQGAERLSTDARGNGADQFHHGIAVDAHGVVHGVFWDRRADPQDRLIQAVHARWDPATGALANAFLEAPWDPDPGNVGGQFLGDYDHADSAAGMVGLAWDVATPQKAGTNNTQIPWDLDVRALVIAA
jgi:hypothetical protein